MKFEDLNITRQFLNAIEEEGFTTPTQIQKKAIPVIASGQHVIGIAQTGTGKTAAYVLPILQRVKYAQGIQPRVLILVPTKELVIQVLGQVQALARYTDIRIAALYGGVGKTKQMEAMANGADVVVATPRRFVELHEANAFQVNHIKTLVLDEADRMLDMGFQPQINDILDVLPRKKQNLLFSATFSDRVAKLSGDFMDFPIRIEIAPEATVVDTVEQMLYELPNRGTKLNLLEHLLSNTETFNRVMIFVKTKSTAKIVEDRLKKTYRGQLGVLHSNKAQNARINTLNSFREGEIYLLIATDVMARGIDVSLVSHVINFDVPLVYDEYVHRIGRTGRAEQSGVAITFATPAELWHIKKIEKRIRMDIPRVGLPKTVDLAATPIDERQEMAKIIDDQKRREDPSFKGAFHDKKHPRASSSSKKKRYKGQGSSTFENKKKSRKTSKKGRHKKR